MTHTTNDAPVTVEPTKPGFYWCRDKYDEKAEWLIGRVSWEDRRLRVAVTYAGIYFGELYEYEWGEEIPHRLAALASAPAEPFPLSDKERAALQQIMQEQELSATAVWRQALRSYQMDHERRKSGETVTWSGDAERAREFAGPLASAPAGDGVEDRDALAERLCAARFPTTVARHPDYYRSQLTEESRERWRVVADAALDRPRAAVGERGAAREILRLAKIFNDGCGHTQNMSGRGDLTEAARLSGVNIYTGDPADCEECSVDFVGRVVAALQTPPAKVEE